jgi:hypothetical protein
VVLPVWAVVLLTWTSEDRIINSFNELLHCLPWLKKKLLSDVDELDSVLKDVSTSFLNDFYIADPMLLAT